MAKAWKIKVFRDDVMVHSVTIVPGSAITLVMEAFAANEASSVEVEV